MLVVNAKALQNWASRGHSRADIIEMCEPLHDQRLYAVLDFDGSSDLKISLSKRIAEERIGHIPAWSQYFTHINEAFRERELRGSVLLWAEDGLFEHHQELAEKAPVLTFSRSITDRHSFLIPDPVYMGSVGYNEQLQEIDQVEKDFPWEKKIPTVFWRGADSNHLPAHVYAHGYPRVEFVKKALELGDPSRLDAYLSRENTRPRFVEAGLASDWVPFAEFFKYRYQVDIEGMASAWISSFTKLASKSLLLKVQGRYEQWYSHQIVPWKHYVPIDATLSNLIEILEWLPEHDEECRQMAEESSRLMRQRNFGRALLETGELLHQIFSFQRD